MDFYIVEFHNTINGNSSDLQVPASLSANDLVRALKQAYDLPIEISDPHQMYLRAESPIILLEGEATLEALGVSNGTRIFFDAR